MTTSEDFPPAEPNGERDENEEDEEGLDGGTPNGDAPKLGVVAGALVALALVVAGPLAGAHHHHRGHHHNVCARIVHTPVGDFCAIGPTPF